MVVPRDEGITSDVSAVQSSNGDDTLVTESGMWTDTRLAQALNACVEILVTLSGIVTVVSPDLSNEECANSVTEFGIDTVVIKRQS